MQENHGNWKQVRRAVLTVLTGAALALGEGAMAQATPRPPERMTYQGFVAGNDGVPLGNTAPKNYDVVLRIFDSEGSNTPLWGEQQTVTVDKGYFSVLLGEGAAVTGVPNAGITLSSLFAGATASDRYVGFTVKGVGAGGTDVEVLPRMRLLTSPYSFLSGRALNADNATTAMTAGTSTNAIKLVRADGADLLTSSGTVGTLNGSLGVANNNFVEFGRGISGKPADAGKIGFGIYSANTLEIFGGASAANGNRRIEFYNEGGAFFGGPVNVKNQYAIQVGIGEQDRDESGGKIWYTQASGVGHCLNITGGGRNLANNRAIRFFAEGGSTFLGSVLVQGGSLFVQNQNAFQVGVGEADRDVTGAMIWYTQGNGFQHQLNISGGGRNGGGNRVVQFHAEGGSRFSGSVTATSFATSSDARVKDRVRTRASSEDLERLRRVRVVGYDLRNPAGPGSPQIGVIAQEIQSVLPDAVTTGQGVAMDHVQDAVSIEYQPARQRAVVRLAQPHRSAEGDRIRVVVDGRHEEVVVASAPDEWTLHLADIKSEPKSLRLTGHWVNDFMSVNYQHVYMTAVSALQEVDRRVQELEKREARVVELERKAAMVESLQRDVAELKRLVAAMGTSGAKDGESALMAPQSRKGPAVAVAR